MLLRRPLCRTSGQPVDLGKPVLFCRRDGRGRTDLSHRDPALAGDGESAHAVRAIAAIELAHLRNPCALALLHELDSLFDLFALSFDDQVDGSFGTAQTARTYGDGLSTAQHLDRIGLGNGLPSGAGE